MLVDSHCHLDRLDLGPYKGDFAQCLQDASAQGIEHMLCVAINLETYPRLRELVDDYPNISVSVGVHPTERTNHEPSVEDLIRLAQDPKVVAIGETGLDYYRCKGGFAAQQTRFRRHIQAAKMVSRPLIIHTREAREDTLQILADEGAAAVGGVLHCFTEDWETARKAMDLNFYISFSGIITFRNAQTLQDVARRVPDDRLLVETDSPYLAPAPYRGKPNYPHHVQQVAAFLAQLRGMTLAEIAALTTRNFYTLFPGARS
jgi:TatD DNase family protein